MENFDSTHDILKGAVKKCVSVDTTIEGPLTSSNDKQYFKAKFKVMTQDDDGYIGQSKLYTKVFFEDSHSLLFIAAQEALENNTPLKILAGRITIPTKRPFYILDENGERMKKKDGSFRMGKTITLFLIADENWRTQYDAQCDQITRNEAWVKEELADEDVDVEEQKVVELEKPAGKKK